MERWYEQHAAPFIFYNSFGPSPAQQRGGTGVGLELYFKCWVTMESGTTEAAGALFHCGARLVHPGSWSQDHLSTNGAVPPLAHIGRFGALLAQTTPNRL